MKLEERLSLVKEVGEEIVTEEELKALLDSKKHPVAYDGFEPSGRIHIAQGILRAININKMTKAGCKFKMLVADWHGWANNKMGGDLDKIQTVGKYFIEVWKSTGMDLKNVEFILVSDYIKDENYWKKVMNVARDTTLQRVLRTTQIMGRTDKEVLQASHILYPCMQAADIFHLEADICQLGMDQRKVNMLAREVGPKLGYWKPVIVSHHMLMGLGQPPASEKDATERAIAMKMSKSNPDSAIFMTDSAEDIKRKITKAYCPEKQVEENPLFDYLKYMIFEQTKRVKVERPSKFGGDVTFTSYQEMADAYKNGKLHPLDVKATVAKQIDELVQPVRKHFETNSKARELKELVDSFQVTR